MGEWAVRAAIFFGVGNDGDFWGIEREPLRDAVGVRPLKRTLRGVFG